MTFSRGKGLTTTWPRLSESRRSKSLETRMKIPYCLKPIMIYGNPNSRRPATSQTTRFKEKTPMTTYR
jgi:hypothetical protein